MTPERKKYLKQCSFLEQTIRGDIEHAKDYMRRYKQQLNEEDLDVVQILDAKQHIAVCKWHISMYKRQLPQRLPPGKLKPCPFCGEKAAVYEDECYSLVAPTLYYVSCLVCDARTPSHMDKAEAIKAWNKRK